MSLLDGLEQELANEIFDGLCESTMDDILDFEFALESAVDEVNGITPSDVDAILDETDPENIAADVTTDDDADDDTIIEEELVSVESELGLGQTVSAFEALLDEIENGDDATEANGVPPAQADPPSEEPADATEGDDAESFEDDVDNDSNLQSLLTEVFN